MATQDEYYAEVKSLLMDKHDLSAESAQDLMDDNEDIIDEGYDKGFNPRWAVERLIEED